MAKTARKLTVAVMAAMTLTSPRLVMANDPIRTIVLRVDNRSGVAPEALRKAHEHAARIYGAIGVSLLWLPVGVDAPGTPVGAFKLSVAILSQDETAEMTLGSGLPKSVLGMAPLRSGRAYIFSDRIARLATSAREPFEMVLGRVIAHEVGHVVLPAQGHTNNGIMSSSVDYRSEKAPTFTDAQGDSIRTLLTVAGR